MTLNKIDVKEMFSSNELMMPRNNLKLCDIGKNNEGAAAQSDSLGTE